MVNALRPLVAAATEIAEPIRGVVVEATIGVQQVVALGWLDGLARLLVVRPVAQFVGRASVQRRERRMILRLAPGRCILLKAKGNA